MGKPLRHEALLEGAKVCLWLGTDVWNGEFIN